ncbi:DEAD/DEAH box helicase (plasmid) [Thermoanaerobacterium thermosaccharolyticum]|uniref:DEAD/DEAH box helicase n=1 Tax=Thermoanaerobacterium thermosaccharolyticum TaxID=1517 RepID=UPI003DA90AC1
MLYDWQKEAIEKIQGENALLSAPTGSGKTKVAYLWSGLIDKDEKILSPQNKIIFTAPIKALSNERYMELKGMGINVGLETGDFKRNVEAPVICCTQEIYTNKYAQCPNLNVVIDEFHYVSTDPERARAYIDGIANSNPTSKILVMSATFGHPESVKKYLERLSNRQFSLYATNERATSLIFDKKPVVLDKLQNALVFVFSRCGVESIAYDIAQNRNRISSEKISILEKLAEIFSVSDIPDICYKGVGMYVGSLLPKEKLFMETAFRNGILDIMVGTDALALGVNLPAETVVFAQLAKYYDGPITKNEFVQMAGRAGRKGYFDTGYVSYYPSDFESFDYDTKELYEELLNAPQEPMEIQMDISVPKLLKGRNIKEEAEYVAKNSIPMLSVLEVQKRIECTMEEINNFAKGFEITNFKEILSDIYFPEYYLWTNLNIAQMFAENETIDINDLKDIILDYEKNSNFFYSLLQLKKYIKTLPKQYKRRVKDQNLLDKLINEIDPTVNDFEERIKNAGKII